MRRPPKLGLLRRLVPIPKAVTTVAALRTTVAALRGDDLEASVPPRLWWQRKSPKRYQVCYRNKSDALRDFLDHNQGVVDEYGGASYPAGCSEFDPINARYGIPKSRCAGSIAEAIWYALRGSGQAGGPPYCLDRIDLEALNDTSPGRIGQGFVLPPHVEEFLADRATEHEYDRMAMEEGGMSDCFDSFRQRGKFIKPPSPAATKGREHRCVCRDKRGRFTKCDLLFQDEVPF